MSLGVIPTTTALFDKPAPIEDESFELVIQGN
jgi:hypothetical protein